MLAFLLLLVVLALIFGVGTVLEAALWTLLIAAVVAVALVLLVARAIRRRLG
jgi:hypothetical protein